MKIVFFLFVIVSQVANCDIVPDSSSQPPDAKATVATNSTPDDVLKIMELDKVLNAVTTLEKVNDSIKSNVGPPATNATTETEVKLETAAKNLDNIDNGKAPVIDVVAADITDNQLNTGEKGTTSTYSISVTSSQKSNTINENNTQNTANADDITSKTGTKTTDDISNSHADVAIKAAETAVAAAKIANEEAKIAITTNANIQDDKNIHSRFSTNDVYLMFPFNYIQRGYQDIAYHSIFILQSLAVLTALIGQVAPLATIRNIIKSKSTGDKDGLPYITFLFSGFVWMLYGFLKESLTLVLPNATAVFFGIWYTVAFHIFCRDSWTKECLRAYYKIYAFLMVFIAVCFIALDYISLVLMIGILSSTMSVISYGSPLSSLNIVLRDKSTDTMPAEISVGNFISSSLWLTYGFVTNDLFVVVPNLLGAIIGSIQLALLALFPPASIAMYHRNYKTHSYYSVPGVIGKKIVDDEYKHICNNPKEDADFVTSVKGAVEDENFENTVNDFASWEQCEKTVVPISSTNGQSIIDSKFSNSLPTQDMLLQNCQLPLDDSYFR